jgi:hypothetical protein
VLLGSDTVFGYRLHQAGAVFVPDDRSSAWHLGPRQIAERGDLAKAYRRPRIANRVPELDPKRPRAARVWETPLADVVIDARGATAAIESSVDCILAGAVPDVRVTLLGDWPGPHPGRHRMLDDPELEARLLLESFRGEHRVRFASEFEPDPKVPYVIRIPAAARPGPATVSSLVEYVNGHRLGLLEVAAPGGAVRLERTAAAARAAHLGVGIDAVWGSARVSGRHAEAVGAFESGTGDPRTGHRGLRGKARGLLRRVLDR